jgi:hypothetical protein
MTHQQLCDIAATSNRIVKGWGVEYKWLRSYVAATRSTACTRPRNVETVREHALGGFPADFVVTVAAEFGPGISSNS